jgi:hypothetical protein
MYRVVEFPSEGATLRGRLYAQADGARPAPLVVMAHGTSATVTMAIDRYSVEIPEGTVGPIAVTAAVYYQSVEAIVAGKFLGNMVDTNGNFELEPCVLGGLCDGRVPHTEPAVVEGAPPVPMIVRNWVIAVDGAGADRTPRARHVTRPRRATSTRRLEGLILRAVRASTRAPSLADARRARATAVDQIGPGTFGLFPPRAVEQAQLTCGRGLGRRRERHSEPGWTTIATDPNATGNTAVPAAFVASQPVALTQPESGFEAAKGKRHGHL